MDTPSPITDTRKILLADDDPYISRAYSFALGKAGFTVIKATNGKEVLTQAREHLPDLILLDQIMPEMDGFETLKALKSDPALAHIPVILFTNLEQPSDVEKGRELGAVDYVVKAQVTMKEVVEKAKQYTTPIA
jgi:CheY-like chemotaxis protein